MDAILSAPSYLPRRDEEPPRLDGGADRDRKAGADGLRIPEVEREGTAERKDREAGAEKRVVGTRVAGR